VGQKDRAFAACLVAQAYSSKHDNTLALRWANQGLALDATLSSCRQIVQTVSQP